MDWKKSPLARAAAIFLVLAAATAAAGSGASAATAQSGKTRLWMMGRSVMAGWFSYHGSDGSTPVTRPRFIFYYKQLEPPPGLISSVRNHLSAERPPKIFFKLCFEDFTGGSREAAEANLAKNKKRIKSVYRLVNTYNRPLIIGNALPKVASQTDAWLVWNHQQYNAWLNAFAASRNRVYIFDQYSALADDNGNLRADYAAGPDESHPNDAGYSAIDAALFPFLRSLF